MSNVPPTLPLERLQVTDGLLLTAERWRIAHAYHRQRQNLHFQAGVQAGIVAGLGVCPMTAPTQIAAQYRDGRWLQVQPGLAIDQEGNPIVVPRPINYRIVAEPRLEPLQVYLVLSFVDPDRLEGQNGTHVVQETFRLQEKVVPPDATEIELCRIWLLPGEVQVRSPRNSFAPNANELDLRHRPWIQPRPKGAVQLGYTTLTSNPNPSVEAALGGLIAALPGLYPALHGNREIGHLALRQGNSLSTKGLLYDLLYLTCQDAQQLQAAEVDEFKTYLVTGGVVLVEVPAIGTALDELSQVWGDVMQALVKVAATERETVYQELRTEQLELERCMALEIATLLPSLAPLLSQEAAVEAAPGGPLPVQHPLRMHPFHFGMFPLLRKTPLALFSWGGVVVAVGGLSTAWGGDETLFLPRDIIRSAQELGVNLLHFAWQRRQWIQCLTPAPIPELPAQTRTPRLSDIYDQLGR